MYAYEDDFVDRFDRLDAKRDRRVSVGVMNRRQGGVFKVVGSSDGGRVRWYRRVSL